MWKLSIVQGLMCSAEFGKIFSLDITDPTKVEEAVKSAKKKFRDQIKEQNWSCAHSPKVFFEPEVDLRNWVTDKERQGRAKIASEIADVMI